MSDTIWVGHEKLGRVRLSGPGYEHWILDLWLHTALKRLVVRSSYAQVLTLRPVETISELKVGQKFGAYIGRRRLTGVTATITELK